MPRLPDGHLRGVTESPEEHLPSPPPTATEEPDETLASDPPYDEDDPATSPGVG